MQKPKLIYYNDSRHYLMYRYDPPLSRHVLRQPVDEILGTGVDTLFFGLASGATFLHDTRIGKRWGEGVTDHNSGIMWWRAGKNLERAIADGLDPPPGRHRPRPTRRTSGSCAAFASTRVAREAV